MVHGFKDHIHQTLFKMERPSKRQKVEGSSSIKVTTSCGVCVQAKWSSVDNSNNFSNHIENQLSFLSDKQFQEAQEWVASGVQEEVDELLNTNLEGKDKVDLWIDKYVAQSYVELMSDEKSNMCVLQWLKQWEKCVFDRTNDGRLVTSSHLKLDQRPLQPILLICGNPGSGKTTLVEMACRQCGYNTVDLNIQLDRGGKSFTAAVQQACQNQNLFGSKRPACILVDGVEEIPQSYVSSLVNLFYGSKPLCRPLICTCTDLYAPNLSQLRQKAYIVKLSGKLNAMIKRLKQISALEGLQMNQQQLMCIAKQCDGDIRSCISTLQTLAGLCSVSGLSVTDIDKLGYKYRNKTSVFKIWSNIMTSDQKADAIIQEVLDFGDSDLLINSLFENYPRLFYVDPQLDVTGQLLDSLVASVLFQQQMFAQMNFSLMPCQTLPAVAFKLLVSGPQNSRMQWPDQLLQFQKQRKENTAIMQSWYRGVCAEQMQSLDSTISIQETLSFLIEYIGGRMKVFDSTCDQTIEQFAEFLKKCGFSFQSNHSGNNNVQLNEILVPPVYRLTGLPDCLCSSRVVQDISRELERQLLQSKVAEHNNDVKNITTSFAEHDNDVKNITTSFNSVKLPMVCKSAFLGENRCQGLGKFMKKIDSIKKPGVTKPVYGVSYSYNVGLTNAIKRNVKMSDLF
eukprot:TRINITY_DN75095_c0_g1_i1.p1 TRINITY_DN75095_c0_g1~~TRINITY_DN75095_c0_g1_i1.p1  ORF type:complete len:678 (+),score=54.03 TRINITY_DN75095_c0_g1_i1:20-2053(+)